MDKKLIFYIDCCRCCIYLTDQSRCSKNENRNVFDVETIPHWCPLEDDV